MSRMIKVVANDGQEVDDNAHNINIEILLGRGANNQNGNLRCFLP